MPIQKYFKTKEFNSLIGLKIFWTIFLMTLLCFSSSAFAGLPIGGKDGIEVYNVREGSFSVVWQVDVDSNCSVKLFTDIDGANPVPEGSYTVYSGHTTSQQLGLTRGVMQVDVKGLPPEVNSYYIQTSSTFGSQEYLFPQPGDLIPVTTEPAFTAVQPINNLLFLLLYDENGVNPTDYHENMITDGVVTIVYAETTDGTESANYPIAAYDSSSRLDNGFPQIATDRRIEIFLGDFRKGKEETGNYWDWDTSKNYSIIIKCFGGAVPGVGLGQAIINTTFLGSWKYSLVGCLDNTDGCIQLNDLNFSQIIVSPNQGPNFELNPVYTVNKNETLTIGPVCATDPEGNAITGFSLGGQPSGMNINTNNNCFTITWTATTCAAVENIQVTASDDQGGVRSKGFKITILNCPPYKPSATIAPQSPVTTQNLTCTATSNGDPDGDNITFIYAWYDVSSPGTILSITSTLNFSQTSKGRAYACKVIARDKDGDSEPFIAGPVTVVNSAPNVPANATVTPPEPTADQNLTCTITAATPPDLDTGDTVQYIYQWKCTSCGTKTVPSSGPTSATSDTLQSTNTVKGENWSCEVKATDGTDQSAAVQSTSVAIANKPPSDPVGVQVTPDTGVKTGSSLTCSIGEPYPTDPDAGDTVTQVFTWKCTGDACTTTSIVRDPTSDKSDTLTNSNTAKNQTWSCEVKAQDNFGGQSNTVTTLGIIIKNSPPEGLATVDITPDPAYRNDDLTCTAGTVTDADGDVISYKYVWKKNGTEVPELTKDFAAGETTNTILASNTSQYEAWSCEVTAIDTSNAQLYHTSKQVKIENQPPVIVTDPVADIHVWDEGGSHEIKISVNDPDGNAFTLTYDDANSVDLNDPNVSAWLTYDSVNNIITANPPAGSSSLDVDFGPGVFKFNFIAEETDADPNNWKVEKMVRATVRIPAEIVDDFEYDSNAPTLAANGWYKLQGTGSMNLMPPTDPNANHYLQTTVSGTPTKNSQLNYIVYKTISDNSLLNDFYPVIEFSVNDKNLYYFDAYVAAKNNAGVEDNYFLRYIPQDPVDAGWTIKVSGKYVSKNIGKQSIDPNGGILVVSSNMEEDLYNATGFHYRYLRGIVLRGDINYIDDIKVRSAGPIPQLKDVDTLTAQGNENQVTLQWALPQNQAPNIYRYNIYMNLNDPPSVDETYKIASVTLEKTSYTKSGLVKDVNYCFRVTAINNLLIPVETSGVTVCAKTEVKEPKDPVEFTAASKDSGIELTWMNPLDKDPDLAGYMIFFSDCNSCPGEFVAASMADSTGLFKYYITKGPDQGPLQFDIKYHFTVKAMDTADPPNFSDGVNVSTVHRAPVEKLIDNFDLGYEAGETLMRRGWYRLQGKGTFLRKEGEGGNYYLEVKSKSSGASGLDYTIVKWLVKPEDFKNPNLKARIRSLGYFRIDVYVRGGDGKNYFLSYKGDPTAESDSTTSITEDKRWFVYKLGWKNKESTTWYDIERNLDDDLRAAKEGVGFDMLLGVLLRGTLDIDDLAVGEGILDAENLTARSGLTSVSLSWTLADPNKSNETRIYVDNDLRATLNPVSDKNDYQQEITGLTTGTTYEFKVVQVVEGDESKGVSIQAAPMEYKETFTFDDQADLDQWSPLPYMGASIEFIVDYNSGVQSNVMYLNPAGDYPDRSYAAKEGIDADDVTGMSCRIKTNTAFVIWLRVEDTSGDQCLLGLIPGGTAGTHSEPGYIPFVKYVYYFLGPGWTDGKWHLLDMDLDDVMNSIFTGKGTSKVKDIYFGGRIYVDDVSIY